MPVTLMPTTDTWTVADLDRLPDDGLRYELVDGALLVSPSPPPIHQRVSRNLVRLLEDACPDELEVFAAPLDFRPTQRRSFQPDVLVVRREDVLGERLTGTPLLVVEILSRSTRVRDTTLKRVVYAESGVPTYWLLDHSTPSLTVLALRGETYEQTALVTGDEVHRATAPYPAVVRPGDLLR